MSRVARRGANRGGAQGAAQPTGHTRIVVAENDVVLVVGPSKDALEQAEQRCSVRRRPAGWSRIAATSTTCGYSSPGPPSWAESWAISSCPETRRHRDPGASRRPDSCRGPTSCWSSATRRHPRPRATSQPARYFGDSIKATAEFSYISIGLGWRSASCWARSGYRTRHRQDRRRAVGRADRGADPRQLRRTGGMNWTIPLSANLVLRNLGLTLFLAQVGMASGPKFAATVSQMACSMFGLGAISATLMYVVSILVLGLLVFRMPYDEVVGIVAERARTRRSSPTRTRSRRPTGPTSLSP